MALEQLLLSVDASDSTFDSVFKHKNVDSEGTEMISFVKNDRFKLLLHYGICTLFIW